MPPSGGEPEGSGPVPPSGVDSGMAAEDDAGAVPPGAIGVTSDALSGDALDSGVAEVELGGSEALTDVGAPAPDPGLGHDGDDGSTGIIIVDS